MAEKLTKAQRQALSQYAGAGSTTQAFGTVSTFNALVQRGLLIASRGLGTIEAEITPAGRAALEPRDER